MKQSDLNFMYDRAAETMARAEIAELQAERLAWSLSRVYDNVPHYRKVFDEAGIKPKDLKSIADIKKFPFTVKTNLRDNYPFDIFATPLHELARVHASSGTTGKPTVVGYTAGDIDLWAGLMARSIAAAGARPGDLVHNAYGYGLFTGGLGAHYGAEKLGCVVVPVSGGGTERQIALMRDFAPRILCSTPSYALHIAEVGEKMGVDMAALPLQRGVFGAEPWTNKMRGELDRRLGLKSIDVYGLSEIMGPGVACECDVTQNGLHGWEDHFMFEIIDPDTLEPLPMGETGELVITTLTKEAMPMIRYRTHDITRLTDEPCECGRTHLRIMRVDGRNDDMMIIRGVNVYPSQIEAVLLGVKGLSPHYQIRLFKQGALDAMAVDVEVAPDGPQDHDALSAKAVELRYHIKSIVGVTCAVSARLPGEVPRSEGKAVRVLDQRSALVQNGPC